MDDSDFTANELAYIKLLKEFGSKLRPYDVSVFRQPISKREDLLNTIFFRATQNSNHNLASMLRFDKSRGMAYGKRPDYYAAKSYPFYKFSSEKDFSDLLCAAILNYIPSLKLPSVERVLPKESTKDEFLRHYNTTIALLLRGPPHANEYGFNEEKKLQWINAQKTEERKRLARLFVEKTIYIPHTKLLQRIQECVQKVKGKLAEGPVTFLMGTKDKSNYYIALLFYHYWKQENLPLDYVKSHMDDFVYGNLIDLDEMAYSGTQTTGTLAQIYGILTRRFHNQLLDLNAKTISRNKNLVGRTNNGDSRKGAFAYNEPVKGNYVKSFAQTPNFLPVGLVESYLAMKGTNYIVVRIFCSENGLEELSRMPPKDAGSKMRGKPPFYLIIGELLPSPQTLFGKEDAEKLAILFSNEGDVPAASAYFNHKIADLPSTFLFPLAYGAVPNKVLGNPYNSWSVKKENKPKINKYLHNLKVPIGEETDAVEFIPFINYCGPNERFMPRSRKNLLEYEPPGGVKEYSNKNPELPQEYRCPYAWYKGIDYETGTYTPPSLPNLPLPHGPTEDNFMGGKRTRKYKPTKLRKTRSKKH